MSPDGQTPWVVGIMAKAPRAGEVKTRLCPPLDPERAAGLARAFLLDAIEQIRSLEAAAHALSFAPETERPFFEELAPDFLLVSQGAGGLGARMVATFEQLFSRGFAGALLVGTDAPTLPTEFLLEALRVIAQPDADLVLGPSEDGGYYLVGLTRARPALFEDMPWSTPDVLAETSRRARQLQLDVALLPTWFDVDAGPDIERLRTSLATAPRSAARHTRRALEVV
ncbi:MAG TPA: TIGR04282 family arsenosugar biosynthesis glycosyltransferase [Candidatus Methylomirabilis sp.]|nr:TIGR04282 family arsenosugar biosynthesis glycosyltransferase [Candidatus Methylomirabilis sp.]